MGGGLLQLVAYGAQDVYLTGNPQVTFFKVSYRRHTNFAMEAIQQTFNGVADFGRTVQCTLSRNGDLLGKTYVYVALPSITLATGSTFRWVNWLGHAMLQTIDFEIGGQRIDRHYGDWLQIWYELTCPAGKKPAYAAIVGNVPALTQLYVGPTTVPSASLHIPLQFFFNRNVGTQLPLIALQYHECKITIQFRAANALYYGTGAYAYGGTSAPSLSSSGGDCQLWCDYVYLDTDERRRMAQVSHEILLEQLQFTGDESFSSGSAQKVKLSFNHPVKSLIWVVQKDEIVDPTDTTTQTMIKGPQWWNYSTRGDKSGFSGFVANGFDSGIISYGASDNTSFAANLSSSTISALAQNVTANSNTYAGISNFDWYSASNITATGTTPLLDLGTNPVLKAKLVLNGSDRFAERNGQYFNQVQPYQHWESSPATGINVYSFAIDPASHQPSGSANFSRIDQAVLNVSLDPATFVSTKDNSTASTAKMRVYAINYNVLRIMSGMGGLAYSS